MGSALENLEKEGIAVASVLNRFGGNEKLMFRLLNKFVDDQSYSSLVKNYENNDLEATNAAAHALKGVSANLGLNSVAEIAAKIHDDLNKGVTDRLDENVTGLKVVYDKIINAIKENCK